MSAPSGDENDPGKGHARQLGTYGVECRTDVGVGAVEGQLTEAIDTVHDVGETEEAEDEAVRQPLEELALLWRERLADELVSGCAVLALESHAARIVDQHTYEVLLRHDAGDDQGRLHQAKHEHPEQGNSQTGHDAPVGDRAPTPRDRVGRDGARTEDSCHPEPEAHVRRRSEGHLSLLEEDRSVLEQKLEQPVHVVSLRSLTTWL